MHVTDNGGLDQAKDDGAFKLTGLAWGECTLTETKAPAGHDKLAKPITVLIDAKHTTVSLGNVTNSRTPATVHYDPNGGEGNMDNHKGHVGGAPNAGGNKFTNKDGKGTSHKKGNKIVLPTGATTLDWPQYSGRFYEGMTD